MTYECKKCGVECEVEEDPGGHVGYSYCWCDECGDIAGGFIDGVPCPADQYGAEMLADQIDYAMMIAKEKKLGL